MNVNTNLKGCSPQIPSPLKKAAPDEKSVSVYPASLDRLSLSESARKPNVEEESKAPSFNEALQSSHLSPFNTLTEQNTPPSAEGKETLARPNELGLLVAGLRTGSQSLTELRPCDSYLSEEEQKESEYHIHDGKLYNADNKLPNKGVVMNYVLTANGKLIVGKQNHDELGMGKEVACAGKMMISKGFIIKKIDRASGSYGPTEEQFNAAIQFLKNQYPGGLKDVKIEPSVDHYPSAQQG